MGGSDQSPSTWFCVQLTVWPWTRTSSLPGTASSIYRSLWVSCLRHPLAWHRPEETNDSPLSL